MAEVFWPNAALEQLDQITAYIEMFDPVAANSIGARLYALGESLASFPNRGRPVRGNMREMVNVRPYVLLYEVFGDRVTILDIRHAAQLPRIA